MNDDDEDYKYHDEGNSNQEQFKTQASNLIKTIKSFGNPFMETTTGLLHLQSRDYADSSVVNAILSLESVGQKQYAAFKEEVFEKSRAKSML